MLHQVLNKLLKQMMRVGPFMRLFAFISLARRSFLFNRISDDLRRRIFTELVVLNGPFKGMVFPYYEWAKLLGSYEDELHDVLDEILRTDYRQVINVGCAEGYYAVGLARRLPAATVYGLDMDHTALAHCRKHAALNRVESRLILEGFCDAARLARFDFAPRTLIFSDCEGYEDELLRPDKIPGLKRCDVLVEVHDFKVPGISEALAARFSHTHEVRRITEKFKDPTKYPQLAGLSVFEQRVVLFEDRISEQRPYSQTWFFLKSKAAD